MWLVDCVYLTIWPPPRNCFHLPQNVGSPVVVAGYLGRSHHLQKNVDSNNLKSLWKLKSICRTLATSTVHRLILYFRSGNSTLGYPRYPPFWSILDIRSHREVHHLGAPDEPLGIKGFLCFGAVHGGLLWAWVRFLMEENVEKQTSGGIASFKAMSEVEKYQ